MRRIGSVVLPSGFGRHDHVCWTYGPDDDLGSAVVDFLTEGIAAGQRVAYTAEASEAALREVVAGLACRDEFVASGALLLLSHAGAYDGAEALDPAEQVSAYASLTRHALHDGFTGFRIAAEATPLVRDVGRRQTFVRYEQLVDRYMAGEPFAAMCAYDVTELGSEAIAEIACVHPAVRGEAPPFQVFAVGGSAAAVMGEIDGFCAELFGRVIDDMTSTVTAVDVSGLRFIDHHGLLVLDRFARDRGGLALTGATPMVRRVSDLLGLDHLRVVG